MYGWYSDNSVLLEESGVYYKFYGIISYVFAAHVQHHLEWLADTAIVRQCDCD